MEASSKLDKLKYLIKQLYEESNIDLPFHGLKHLRFVATKSVYFGKFLDADLFITESSAWVHDLNYFLRRDYNNHKEGEKIRKKLLENAGYTKSEVNQIEKIVSEISTWSRDESISNEAKALSDADMLFSTLPITPIYFTKSYLLETGQSLEDLAKTILKLRNNLMDRKIYFYSNIAQRKYLKWGKTALTLFKEVLEALEDEEIKELIKE